MKFHTAKFNKCKVILFVILLLVTIIVAGCNRPKPTAYLDEPIDLYQDPVQDGEYTVDKITISNLPDFYCTLNPQANYKIAAVVAGKKVYYGGWAAKVAPVDLALTWGKLTDSENKRYITYSQSNRWYFFRYSQDCPVDASYISSHSANHHIIPANQNISRAVRSLKPSEAVFMEGYLVNLSGIQKGSPIWWNTSLTRSDTGDGACELFYVKRIQVGKWVYE